MTFAGMLSESKINIKKVVLDAFKKFDAPHSARVDGDRGLFRITTPGMKSIIIHEEDYNSTEELLDFLKDKLSKKHVSESVPTTPDDLLRKKGFKIKLVTPTKFGIQIDFAKEYPQADIKETLKDFTLKFDGKSIFVVE